MAVQTVDRKQAYPSASVAISPRADDKVLREKFAAAEATMERARESMKSGKLTVEHRRYLNQLFTSISVHENVMSW